MPPSPLLLCTLLLFLSLPFFFRFSLLSSSSPSLAGQSSTHLTYITPTEEGGTITFNLPDGPPPADLRLSSEFDGTDTSVEEVRKALQLRWDLFSSFPESLQTALKSEKLKEVNKVLGKMEVPEAEDVVEKLQMGGMLMFSEPGVRDATKEAEEFPDRF